MHVYKFRVALDDTEEFIRDIEMESKHTFEDFHKTLIDAIGFDGSQLASFFVADNNWRKYKEITLLDMVDPEIENGESNTEMMRNTRLCDFIEDPHQRFIYVYDYIKMWSFYIELLKIQTAEKNIKYPRCVKTIGDLPKKMTSTTLILQPDEEDESILATEEINEKIINEEDDFLGEEYKEDSPELSDGFEELKF
jgi:hypothetical protein